MEKKHVLVVDDDLILLKTAEEILSEFYSVSVAKAGSQAIALLEKGVIPDLILLDIAMPGMDGYETLNEMKKIPAAGSVPIIFLTGFSDADYEVRGLKSGAVDYIVKPFLPKELIYRVNAILRRSYKGESPIVKLSGSEIDFDRAEVIKKGEHIALTAKEHDILAALYRNAGRIVTIDALCEAAWGDNPYGYENSLMAHIRRIREKIELNPKEPEYLKVVWGIGYKIEKK